MTEGAFYFEHVAERWFVAEQAESAAMLLHIITYRVGVGIYDFATAGAVFDAG